MGCIARRTDGEKVFGLARAGKGHRTTLPAVPTEVYPRSNWCGKTAATQGLGVSGSAHEGKIVK